MLECNIGKNMLPTLGMDFLHVQLSENQSKASDKIPIKALLIHLLMDQYHIITYTGV